MGRGLLTTSGPRPDVQEETFGPRSSAVATSDDSARQDGPNGRRFGAGGRHRVYGHGTGHGFEPAPRLKPLLPGIPQLECGTGPGGARGAVAIATPTATSPPT